MVDKTYTVTGLINGQHAKTGEIIYWEREVYQRNGTSCVVKSYINLNMHVIASFKTRQDAESFERFRIEAATTDVTTEGLKQMANNARFIGDDNLRRTLFFKVLWPCQLSSSPCLMKPSASFVTDCIAQLVTTNAMADGST